MTEALQTSLHVCVVLQGIGPAFQSKVSCKVEDCLQIESVDPPLHSQVELDEPDEHRQGQEPFPKPQQLYPEGPVNILEKLFAVPWDCSE